jgi:hypothetical protein
MKRAEQSKTTTASSSSLTAEHATASLCSLNEYGRVKFLGSVVLTQNHFSKVPITF